MKVMWRAVSSRRKCTQQVQPCRIVHMRVVHAPHVEGWWWATHAWWQNHALWFTGACVKEDTIKCLQIDTTFFMLMHDTYFGNLMETPSAFSVTYCNFHEYTREDVMYWKICVCSNGVLVSNSTSEIMWNETDDRPNWYSLDFVWWNGIKLSFMLYE